MFRGLIELVFALFEIFIYFYKTAFSEGENMKKLSDAALKEIYEGQSVNQNTAYLNPESANCTSALLDLNFKELPPKALSKN